MNDIRSIVFKWPVDMTFPVLGSILQFTIKNDVDQIETLARFRIVDITTTPLEIIVKAERYNYPAEPADIAALRLAFERRIGTTKFIMRHEDGEYIHFEQQWQTALWAYRIGRTEAELRLI